MTPDLAIIWQDSLIRAQVIDVIQQEQPSYCEIVYLGMDIDNNSRCLMGVNWYYDDGDHVDRRNGSMLIEFHMTEENHLVVMPFIIARYSFSFKSQYNDEAIQVLTNPRILSFPIKTK